MFLKIWYRYPLPICTPVPLHSQYFFKKKSIPVANLHPRFASLAVLFLKTIRYLLAIFTPCSASPQYFFWFFFFRIETCSQFVPALLLHSFHVCMCVCIYTHTHTHTVHTWYLQPVCGPASASLPEPPNTGVGSPRLLLLLLLLPLLLVVGLLLLLLLPRRCCTWAHLVCIFICLFYIFIRCDTSAAVCRTYYVCILTIRTYVI